MVSLMKYQSSSPYIKEDGQIWSVNADTEKGYIIYTKQMKEIIKQINLMCDNYRRVFWIVFDLHMPKESYTGSNEVMSQFLSSLSKEVKPRYGINQIGYSWCREIEKAKQQHYHVMMMFDGKQIRHSDTFFDIVKKHWAKASHGGSSWMPDSCYGSIFKDDFAEKQKLIFRVSYQAKGRGKGYRDKRAKDYSTSRLKLNSHKKK